jgi:hypothetical protein
MKMHVRFARSEPARFASDAKAKTHGVIASGRKPVGSSPIPTATQTRIPEIPRAFEEAAFVDRSSGLYGGCRHRRLCRIPSWNEFGFAMTLNNYDTRTEPVYFAGRDPAAHGIAEPCLHYSGVRVLEAWRVHLSRESNAPGDAPLARRRGSWCRSSRSDWDCCRQGSCAPERS